MRRPRDGGVTVAGYGDKPLAGNSWMVGPLPSQEQAYTDQDG